MERNDIMITLSIIASIVTVSTFLAFVIYPLHHPAVTTTPATPATPTTPSAVPIVTPTPQVTPSPSPPTITPTPRPSTPTPSPTLGNDDAFIEFYLDTSSNIHEGADAILEALGAEEKNYPELETRAANLETLAEKYLLDIEEYHVSEELSPVKIKLREGFFELKFASQTLKNGARNQDPGKVVSAIELFINSLNIFLDVGEQLRTFIHTSK